MVVHGDTVRTDNHSSEPFHGFLKIVICRSEEGWAICAVVQAHAQTSQGNLVWPQRLDVNCRYEARAILCRPQRAAQRPKDRTNGQLNRTHSGERKVNELGCAEKKQTRNLNRRDPVKTNIKTKFQSFRRFEILTETTYTHC
eukprot:751404-Hanusia_phi.AAC.1